MSTKMTPQLRFPEFTDDWQVKKLGDILSIGSGRDYKHLNKGDMPVYGTGGLMTWVDDYLYDGKSVAIGRKGTIDQPQFLTGKFWTVDTLFYTHDYKNSVPEFVFSLFQNINWKKWNEASGVPSLSSSTIKSIKVTIPSKPEQEKIADFLTAVDERIRLQEQKLVKLEQYKRGVMQQIFSQKIRFKDENGNEYPEWEDKRLGDQLIEGSKSPVEDTMKHKKITIGLNKTGVRAADISRKMADTRPFYIRNANEIIIGKQNYFNGSIAIIPESFDGTICSNAIMSFKVNTQNSTKFIYEAISRRDFLKQREALANGTGQKELSESEFLNFKLLLPSIEEQQKISTFLTALDDKITTEKSKLTAAKKFKKALLQRMFV